MRKTIITLIVILTGVVLYYCFSMDIPTDKYKDLWPFVAAIATVLLWFVALQELGGVNSVAKTDFARRFNADFFGQETRDLVMLFDYKALKFKIKVIEQGKDDSNSKKFPFFEIQKNILTKLVIHKERENELSNRGVYTAFEIDDFLLGLFEEIAALEKRGMLDIKDVYNNFDWYIDLIWNNEEIQKYIESQMVDEKEGEDIYEDFKYIYEKCDSYGKAKLANKWLWLWKVKWNVFKR